MGVHGCARLCTGVHGLCGAVHSPDLRLCTVTHSAAQNVYAGQSMFLGRFVPSSPFFSSNFQGVVNMVVSQVYNLYFLGRQKFGAILLDLCTKSGVSAGQRVFLRCAEVCTGVHNRRSQLCTGCAQCAQSPAQWVR